MSLDDALSYAKEKALQASAKAANKKLDQKKQSSTTNETLTQAYKKK